MKKILILFAHPGYNRSHANKALLQALRKVEGIHVHDLYQRYPNMFIDVAYEQQLLQEHDIIVFQHPLYWYSAPAIIKEWMDQVLEYGFAFGPEGHALKGKLLLSAITTGGSQESYTSHGHNRRAVIEYLLPFRQTAWLCGMRYLPPFVLYSYHTIQDAKLLRDTAQEYRRLLIALRDGTLSADSLQRATYLTDLIEELP
ncbi:NAD(P)H-dependent oxidoreductase [Pseudaeromonas sharmana]|uniref:NAD(P)H-dependent oxidoreductase n=1 Tax=Pseudaeromonas sharmana TaxID=328412 RepID=A0ABV8CMY6_9GAMM